jgi:hypothetical protein
MTTLLCAALLQPGIVPFVPELRKYEAGDRWVYTLQAETIGLHTYAVDLTLEKDEEGSRVFQARQTQPAGGNATAKSYDMFVLFIQDKASRDATFLARSGKDIRYVPNLLEDRIAPGLQAEDSTLIFPGTWDTSPKPGSSTSFLTTPGRTQQFPYKYVGREVVDTGFAAVECAVFETKQPNGDYMKFWFNPTIGNFVKSQVTLAKRKLTTIGYLKETNVLPR